MARRARLDAELVRRKLARSREQAAQLVAAGRVQVRGTVAHKVAAMVDPADPVLVTGEDPRTEYVSRGGHKLAGALAAFAPSGLTVEGRRCLDAGASTGGFTDVLLRAGADRVVAVDVGYGQLAWPIRTDERVDVHERTNVRTLTPDVIGGPVDLVVADLSFISLRLVLPALTACTAPEGDLALMVKPQFEVGKDRLAGTGGVVRDWRLRAEAVLDVAATAAELGLGVAGVAASPLPGPSGNVEFFVWFRRGAPPADRERVEAVVEAGPAGAGLPAELLAEAAAASEPPGEQDYERPEPAAVRADQPAAPQEDT
ncbi:TlyA family RNA methyltransferase [Actinoplanes sp. NPDC020271]|uniref:TlyA family RNA methyltransferase n=1 Tax=Actinoplanes sp. NPDC020271 TaxID=3363896 RepID=UPI00379704CA